MAAKKNFDKTQAPAEPAARTSAGLRAALFDELDGLRNGTVNATRANATAKLCATIVETVRLELDVARYVEKNKGTVSAIGMANRTLDLTV